MKHPEDCVCKSCIKQAVTEAAEQVLSKFRQELRRCGICGGEVDLSHATQPTVKWYGGRGNRKDN